MPCYYLTYPVHGVYMNPTKQAMSPAPMGPNRETHITSIGAFISNRVVWKGRIAGPFRRAAHAQRGIAQANRTIQYRGAQIVAKIA